MRAPYGKACMCHSKRAQPSALNGVTVCGGCGNNHPQPSTNAATSRLQRNRHNWGWGQVANASAGNAHAVATRNARVAVVTLALADIIYSVLVRGANGEGVVCRWASRVVVGSVRTGAAEPHAAVRRMLTAAPGGR